MYACTEFETGTEQLAGGAPIMTATFGAHSSSGNPFQRSNSIPALPDFQLFHIRVHKKKTTSGPEFNFSCGVAFPVIH
jgi:hypothetical protein